MNRKNKICAGALAFVIFTGMASASASALTHKTAERSLAYYDDTELYSYQEKKFVSTIASKNVWSYIRPTVKLNNTTVSVKGLNIGGVYYLPFRAAANALGASYSYNSSSRTATLTASGLVFSSSDGCYVSYANGRALFSISPTVIMSDGRMYVPADVFAKAIGMKASTSDDEISITGTYKALTAANKFYREDEVLWLARIIHAEAQGEPLLGQIAVGGVVLNRVKSPSFPNTIYSVIFDRKYGVQFSPILNGTIYNTPSYNSTLAAKICLEGTDVSEGALYFLQPHLSTSSWIPKNRPYAYTIGNHDFYK